MIAASSLAFPGSKPLAHWWRQLASFRPQALWTGHLLLHRLEVLADVVQPETVDPLSRLVLQAVALERLANHRAAPDPLPALKDRLHLEAGVILRIVQDLQARGFVDDHADLTEQGLGVLYKGIYPRRRWRRREFVFAERTAPSGQRRAAPHFLPLAGATGPAWQPDEQGHFRLEWLHACLDQPAQWKEMFGFPRETMAIADPADTGHDPPAWQRVVIDRPIRQLIVLIASDDQLLGFAARQDGWELASRDPVLALPSSACSEFPELALPTGAEFWTTSWQAWCHSRNLAAADVNQCTLQPIPGGVQIHIPENMRRQLVASKSDVLKDGTWLLAGTGYVRSAARVQIED